MLPADLDFLETVRKAKVELLKRPEFQEIHWKWVHELDDDGFFIFCYLLEDVEQEILSVKKIEETVYTLVMLKHKFFATPIKEKFHLSEQWVLQCLFKLYESLKKQNFSWDDCELFIEKEISAYVQKT